MGIVGLDFLIKSMTITEINLAIQYDWINRQRNKEKIEMMKLEEKARKKWARYYKKCLKLGLAPDTFYR